MTYVVNPIVRRTGLACTLTVPGRRSGALHTTPLGRPFQYDGQRYLVSGRGQTQWARNLRAAERGEIRFHGRREPFRAVEVHGLERDRVVEAYRLLHGHSVDRYFREIPEPENHPVFRIEPIEPAATAA